MFDRIRLRLTLGYVGILALILVAFGLVLVAGFRGATVGQHDNVLTEQAEALAGTIARGDAVDTQRMNGSDEYAWSHLAPDGRVLERDTTARDLGLPSVEAARRSVREGEPIVVTAGGARVASVPVMRSGEVAGAVQVGRPIREELETVDRLVLVLVPIGLASLVLAGVGGLFVSRRAMRPVGESFARQRAFVADASHELKTPLSLIKIDAEVLLRDPAAPDGREIVVHQLSEIDRMSATLSDLLVMARLDSGKLDVELKPFDLASVLEETVDRFRARATAGGIDLRTETPGELPARGDAERTAQVLGALLDNALRFTPEGGRVTVASGERNDRVEAVVTDTGPGIPAGHLSRVFDRFYRADAARNRGPSGGGTGLGLTIARDLARAQGGDVTVDKDGGGATFRVSIPRG